MKRAEETIMSFTLIVLALAAIAVGVGLAVLLYRADR
jgi:NADH:ubiquinone oxidoreductase subunit K